MMETPYENIPREQLSLADRLAIDRTLLANERTLLAWERSALALLIVGITFVHFFSTGVLLYIGIVFIPSGFVVAGLGFKRYRRMNISIRSACEFFEGSREGQA
jgi:putative membrane protein